MTRRFILLFAAVMTCLVGFAQNTDAKQAAKQINAIKANKKYIYAESTTKDWVEAYSNAKDLLANNIEEWIQSENKNADVKGYVAKVANNIQEIKTQRGNLYRAFVYIRKSDIMTYEGGDDIVESQVAPAQMASDTSLGRDARKSRYNDDVYVTTTPKGDSNQTDAMQSEIAHIEPAYHISDTERRMLALTDPSEIQSYLKANAATYGKLATMPQGDECYVLVFSKTNVETCIAHHANGTATNLKTLAPDSIDNYKGKGLGAIWFKVKK